MYAYAKRRAKGKGWKVLLITHSVRSTKLHVVKLGAVFQGSKHKMGLLLNSRSYCRYLYLAG